MEKKTGWLGRLKEGLGKTNNWFAGLFGAERIDDAFYEELEEAMILADVGMETSDRLLDELRDKVKAEKLASREEAKAALVRLIADAMRHDGAFLADEGPCVLLIVGVNGVGKTTSIGKLASVYRSEGKKVLIAAADTFRAAATEQLEEWAKRAGVDMISGTEGGDPGSVIYDAVSAAKARRTDILLCDTAGRLHNKKNLMEELAKIDRIITREYPGCIRENLVVLDAATGQNALAQAREFSGVTNLTGIILTKMDGTAKGGIAIAVQSELKIPVKFIGIGEQVEDLQRFDPDAFIDALFTQEPKDEESAEN